MGIDINGKIYHNANGKRYQRRIRIWQSVNLRQKKRRLS